MCGHDKHSSFSSIRSVSFDKRELELAVGVLAGVAGSSHCVLCNAGLLIYSTFLKQLWSHSYELQEWMIFSTFTVESVNLGRVKSIRESCFVFSYLCCAFLWHKSLTNCCIPYVTLEHKTSRWFIFVAIAKNTLYLCVKIIDFSFMPKIVRIISKDHVPWRYL